MPITRDGVELTVEISEKAPRRLSILLRRTARRTALEFAWPSRAAAAPA